MDAQLTNDQIIGINTRIADYIIETPQLTNNDQFYDVIVTKEIPAHVKLNLGAYCHDNRLFCTFTTYYHENTSDLRLAIWSYDYKPLYQVS